MMHGISSTEVVGEAVDGEILCEDCMNVPDDEEESSPVFADDLSGGTVCGGTNCGNVWIDGEWRSAFAAMHNYTWYVCPSCGTHTPTADGPPDCACCGKDLARQVCGYWVWKGGEG